MNNLDQKSRDDMGINVSGHIVIRDAETGEELVNKRNAIHYGNMAFVVAQALNNEPNSFIKFMAFGNGATSVDTAGRVVYKTPRVTESVESGANLYSRTFFKSLRENAPGNSIEIVPGASFSDIVVTCTLGFGEPAGQELFDSSVNNEGEFVFDELALFTAPTTGTDANNIDAAKMLTHVVFHPVQKSANRVIEVVYTVRVQLS